MNKLAIVIPYYKIDFFEETLQSVAAQTDRRFTLYIGNDASPNDPMPLIKKYFPDGGYHYFDYQENLGGKNLAMQWERILENVTEEWFQILGDDDMISENFVEEFYNNYDQLQNINIVKVTSLLVNDSKNVLHDSSSYYVKRYYPAIDLFLAKIEGKINSSLSEHLFRRSILFRIKFKKYPLAWHSDDMAILSVSEGKLIYVIREATVLIRISSKSITGTNDDHTINDKKSYASCMFYSDILSEFLFKIPRKSRENLIIKYLQLIHYYKVPPAINLYKAYLSTNKPWKVLAVPTKLYILRKNSS